jgi:hypothetical protein
MTYTKLFAELKEVVRLSGQMEEKVEWMDLLDHLASCGVTEAGDLYAEKLKKARSR